MVGDQRVEGTWRPIFIHNGRTYYLIQLTIYEDGLVDCGGLIGDDEFRQKVASGRVTVEVPAGAHVSMHDLGHWTVAEQTSHLTGEDLVLEVIDEIDRLAGRSTSVDRCMAALDAFLQTPDEARRDERSRDREWEEERRRQRRAERRPAVQMPQTTYVKGWPAKPRASWRCGPNSPARFHIGDGNI